ncbi:peptidoglycan editing factor PgeF [Sporolactobacillus sp. THM7-7]|nr:peptidoglycan editing factor PgeF [Sporolactobacillus sp. THM7-7]
MTEPFSVLEDCALLMKPVFTGKQTIISGFSRRTGGVSRAPYESMNLGLHVGDDSKKVRENRRILAENIGFPLERWVCAEQVHGIDIARVTGGDAGSGSMDLDSVIKGADGLYTTEAGILLALFFADCVPIFFYAPEYPAIGLLHAGWRGTVKEGAKKMVRTWGRTLRLSPGSIHAVIGPAISGSAYEVDERVIREVKKLDKTTWLGAVTPRGNGHYLLDLQALNRSILIQSGIPERQIHVTGYGTDARPDVFFSFRRDHGKTGRMMGFIGMKE